MGVVSAGQLVVHAFRFVSVFEALEVDATVLQVGSSTVKRNAKPNFEPAANQP